VIRLPQSGPGRGRRPGRCLRRFSRSHARAAQPGGTAASPGHPRCRPGRASVVLAWAGDRSPIRGCTTTSGDQVPPGHSKTPYPPVFGADQPTRRVTGGSERTQAAVQVWRVWAAIVPQRSLWCANWQVEARVTYRRRRSDLCLTGILPSDVMFLTGSAGGLSACQTGEAPKPVPAAALISSPRAWWLLDEMAPRVDARCRRGRAADGRT
jgi:hypothetical protein